jgi:hypothetical protein
VPNLNAQYLDGLTSGAFYGNGSTVANSNALDGLSASAFGDRWFAVVAPNGGLIAGNGVSSTQRYAPGQYAVRFTGNIHNASQCAGIATLEQNGPGWINVVPTAFSEFDVYVTATNGSLSDAEFAFYAVC